MRNSKVKGFTLIELIVVIAIIGILAAILVPSMLGYVRNARISQANANAKQIHTAVSSALTQLGIANVDLKGSGTATGVSHYVDVAASDGTQIAVAFTGPTTAPTTAQMDLVSYLGENFNGHGRAYFNPATYSVSVAIYAAAPATGGDQAASVASNSLIVKAVTHLSDNSGTLKNEISEQTQKSDAKGGDLYGVYPQGTD